MTAAPRPASSPTARPRFDLRRLAPFALLALGACAPMEGLRVAGFTLIGDGAHPQTERLAAPLRPLGRPGTPLAASFSAKDLRTGATLRFDARRYGQGVRVRQSDGCVWTRSGDWFAPSDSWANCDGGATWATGRAEVRSARSIWPLKPGAEGRWTRKAVSHTGKTYTRDTVCRVVGAEAVIRERGAKTPAHVVECSDGKRTRTTWYAPDEGPVAFRKVHAENGVEEAWVRF
ncbi:MAG: hypothetical protein ACFCUS_09680 [Rubrimonas sp.]|uniref:hypothetical protein n=1 Tax=Rubrimonas sp. TaxID=2036015 RepID=UPI002FDEE340